MYYAEFYSSKQPSTKIVINKEVGTLFNDCFYVDRSGSMVSDLSTNDTDTIFSSVTYDLSLNTQYIENLVLQNWDVPLKTQLQDAETYLITPAMDVYGHPTVVDLEYMQGDNNAYIQQYENKGFYDEFNAYMATKDNKFVYKGTCLAVSIANILKMEFGSKIVNFNNKSYDLTTEKDIVHYAADKNFLTDDIKSLYFKYLSDQLYHFPDKILPYLPGNYEPANTLNYIERYLGEIQTFPINRAYDLLNEYVKTTIYYNSTMYYPSHIELPTIANKIIAGHGVIMGLSNFYLGVSYDSILDPFKANHFITLTGVVKDNKNNIIGFYASDTGRFQSRPLIYTYEEIEKAFNTINGLVFITDEPLKLKIDSYGNNLNGTGNELSNHITGNDGDNILRGEPENYIVEDPSNLNNPKYFNDILEGGAGNDYLYGEIGNDTLDGGAGNDHLYGGVGDDTYKPGSGIDEMIDIGGFDKYIFDWKDFPIPGLSPITQMDNKYIIDSDGKGQIYINDTPLTGGELVSEGKYKDVNLSDVFYYWTGSISSNLGKNLMAANTVADDLFSGSDLIVNIFGTEFVVKGFNNTDLGIELKEKEPESPTFFSLQIEENVYQYTLTTEPLIIDLNGDGIKTTTAQNGIYFDMKADGFAELTAWADWSDGVLALDLNNNGIIDSGKELFGSNTDLLTGGVAKNGYEALAQYDLNADHIIDSKDAVFSKLVIIRSYGLKDLDEAILYSLEEEGIQFIDLNYVADNTTDENGNIREYSSSVVKTDGTTLQMGSYFLNGQTTETKQLEWLEVPPEIEALPDSKGYGEVYTLHQAMVRDTSGEIQTLVEDFVNETNIEAREDLVDQLLLKWTNSDGIDPASRGIFYDAQKLNVIETFLGRQYTSALNGASNPQKDDVPLLDSMYTTIKNQIYSDLIVQTHIKDLFDLITNEYNYDYKEYVYDFKAVTAAIIDLMNTDPVAGDEVFREFARISSSFKLHYKLGFEDFYNTFKAMDETYADIIDSVDKRVLSVDSPDNIYTGTTLDDFIKGTANADYIGGSKGADIIRGGLGDDEIISCAGDDIVYGEEGNDRINTVSGADIIFGGDGNDILLAGADDDRLYGESGNDTMYGAEDNDLLFGGDGDDYILGDDWKDTPTYTYGDDIIYGEAGNDTIWGNSGDDIIHGGAGHDILHGDDEKTSQAHGEDIIYGDDGDDVIYGNGNNDTLYGGAGNDTIYGDDLVSWQPQGDDTIFGGIGDDRLYGNGGNDNIYGEDGTDVIYGDAGDDHLYGGNDADTLYGGLGDDVLVGGSSGSGIDLLSGGFGNDTYIINLNDGTVQIDDSYSSNDASKHESNIIQFGDGITKSMLQFSGVNLTGIKEGIAIAIEGYNNLVYINKFFNKEESTIEKLVFADGTEMNKDEIENALLLEGTASNDTINGTDAAETIYAYEGNDTINAGDGDDKIYSGIGNDSISLGKGSDTIYYNLGDGIDTVELTSGNMNTYNEFDQIVFGEGILKSAVTLEQQGSNLAITINTNDQIILNNYFNLDRSAFNKLVFSNGEETVLKEAFPLAIKEGTTGNDVIGVSSSAGNAIYGYEGNDVLVVNGTGIFGDYIDGGAGADIMDGEMGDDTYVVDNINDKINEEVSEGYDKVLSSVSYTLPSYVEVIELTGSSDINATGNSYNNILIGNSGINILTGSYGDDTYVVNNIEDSVIENIYEGIDLIQSTVDYTLGENIENLELIGNDNISGTGNELDNIISGNSGDNILSGGDGNDIISGGQGNDILSGEAGNNILLGQEGDDIYVIDDMNDKLIERSNEGIDTVRSSISYTLMENFENLELQGEEDLIGTGNASDNILTGNSGNNTLYGLDGNDTFYGQEGNDLIEGGQGNDTIYEVAGYNTLKGGEGDDVISGGLNTDIIYGDEGNDTLLGLEGDDELYGGDGNDTIYGGIGYDTLEGGAGADTLYGNTEDDTYIVDEFDTVIEEADEGDDTVIADFSYTLTDNVENLELSGDQNITGTGNALDNIISGNEGDNTLYGLDGNDILMGNAGADTMIGGLGDDTYYVEDETDLVTELIDEGNDTIVTSFDYTLGENVENLTFYGEDNITGTGNALDNIITGNTGDNILNGLDGNDTLDGGLGLDTLYGGLGDDTYVIDEIDDVIVENEAEGTDKVLASIDYTLGSNLENLELSGYEEINATGNSADNIITGNISNNILEGKEGNDTLIGNDGNDTYLYNLGDGNDIIINNDNSPFNTDTIQFGEGIVQSDITYSLVDNDLVLNIVPTGESITVKDYFISDFAKVDTLLFADSSEVLLFDLYPNPVISGDVTDNTLEASLELQGYNLYGYEGNDTLTGHAGNDLLDGGTGIDTMTGGEGYDTYIVDNVDDVVIEDPYGGYDTVKTSVNFTIPENIEYVEITGTDNVNITGNADSNMIQGNAGDNIIHAGDGFDFILGGEGNDTLYGENDSDLLDGGAGVDTLYGGTGDDYYIIDNELDVIVENVDEGIDEVTSTVTYTIAENVENIVLTGSDNIHATGNNIDNEITGNEGDNILQGLDGNDLLIGSGGNDFIHGGTGDDYLVGTDSTTYFYSLGDGYDVISHTKTEGNIGSILFDAGIDQSMIAFETYYDSLVITFNGNEDDQLVIYNHFGDVNNQIDKLVFNDGSEVIPPFEMIVDELEGTEGDDNITGTSGDDVIHAYGGNDVVTALAGNDLLDGGSGTDTLIGGTGDDTYIVDSLGDVIIENKDEGIDSVQSSTTYSLSNNVENVELTGTSHANLTGNSLNNILKGNTGNNILAGLDGDDVIYGEGGTDRIIGGKGNDTITASGEVTYIFNKGDGIDTINHTRAEGVESKIVFGLGINYNYITGEIINNDVELKIKNTEDKIILKNYLVDNTYRIDKLVFADNSEHLISEYIGGIYGTDGDDIISGTDNDDTIWGLDGNDRIYGNAGDDKIYGGVGNDLLYGGLGDDTIDTGPGSIDGTGQGSIQPGQGNDFVFCSGKNRYDYYQSYEGTEGIDTIQLDMSPDANTFLNLWVWGTGYYHIYSVNNNFIIYLGNKEEIKVLNYFEDSSNLNDIMTLTYYCEGSFDYVNPKEYFNTLPRIEGTSNADNLIGSSSYVTTEMILGYEGNDTITGGNGTTYIYGGSGNDTITDTSGNNYIEGNEGDDIINCPNNSSHNVIVGGQGNDTLNSGGLVSYYFSKGDGIDTFHHTNYSTSSVAGNIVFGDDILPDDIIIETVGNNLEISILNTEDKIIVEDYFASALNKIANFEFSNGYRVTIDEFIANYQPKIIGSNTDDEIIGSNLNDVIYSYDGNDTISSGEGDDIIYGGDGNDYIDADGGNDTIYSGTGIDTIIGGTGNDTIINSGGAYYIFNSGDGVDVITQNKVPGEESVIIFGNGINLEDLNFENINGNLQISINNTEDKLIINDYFVNELNVVDKIKFANNSTIVLAEYLQNLPNNIIGTDGDDILYGTEANDVMSGLAGNDELYGSAGNDILDGGTGSDYMEGNTGDDTYIVDDYYDVVVEQMNEGIDTVKVENPYMFIDFLPDNVENLILIGSENIDSNGNNLDNVVTGNSGNNIIDTFDGNDVIYGRAGNDDINGGNGNDTIYGEEGNDYLYGSQGDDKIYGGTGDDLLYGHDGNDLLDGGSGNDILKGSTGNDTYIIDNINDLIVEDINAGIDTIQTDSAEVSSQLLQDNIENLTITGISDMEAHGNTLDNIITGNAGSNKIYGYDGNDTLYGNGGNDTIYAGNGNDTAYGGYGDDFIRGEAGDDILYGGDGNDFLMGNEGNDILDGGIDSDHMEGGAGDDTYIMDFMYELVIEKPDEGIDTIKTSASFYNDYRLPDNVENLILFDQAAEGNGNILDNTIIGNILNNIIKGYEGNDTLYGYEGNDTLDGGADIDTLYGGTGNDNYIVDNTSDVIFENSGEGIDTVTSSANYTLPTEVENLILTGVENLSAYGNELNNNMSGNSGNNSLFGYAGNDILNGNDGDDTLDGGLGIDQLYGGGGNDTYIVDNSNDVITELANNGVDTVFTTVNYTLSNNVENITLSGTDNISATGNDSDNVITGNSGNNTLTGNAGNDTINGEGGNDTIAGGTGDDTLTASGGTTYLFNVGDGSDTVYHTKVTGTESQILFGENITSSNINIQQVNSDLEVSLNNTGDKITVKNYFVSDANKLDKLVFADNSEIDLASYFGKNRIEGNNRPNWLVGTNFPDDIFGFGGRDFIFGRGGDDYIEGGNGKDYIFGGRGNDILLGNNGDDTISGGAGNDYIEGGNGKDLLNGDCGDDILLGGNGNDILNGGLGNDYINGNEGSDQISGEWGNDYIVGSKGNDCLAGGLGSDTYIFSSGDGKDSINDVDYWLNGTDTVLFDQSVAKEDIAIFMERNDLKIKYGQSDLIDVTNQDKCYAGIEEIKLSDGSYLTDDDINALIQDLTSFARHHGIHLSKVQQVANNEDLMNIVINAWHT